MGGNSRRRPGRRRSTCSIRPAGLDGCRRAERVRHRPLRPLAAQRADHLGSRRLPLVHGRSATGAPLAVRWPGGTACRLPGRLRCPRSAAPPRPWLATEREGPTGRGRRTVVGFGGPRLARVVLGVLRTSAPSGAVRPHPRVGRLVLCHAHRAERRALRSDRSSRPGSREPHRRPCPVVREHRPNLRRRCRMGAEPHGGRHRRAWSAAAGCGDARSYGGRPGGGPTARRARLVGAGRRIRSAVARAGLPFDEGNGSRPLAPSARVAAA